MRPPGAVFTLVRTSDTTSNKTVYGNAVWQPLNRLKLTIATRNTQHAEQFEDQLSPTSYRPERGVRGVDGGLPTELLGLIADDLAEVLKVLRTKSRLKPLETIKSRRHIKWTPFQRSKRLVVKCVSELGRVPDGALDIELTREKDAKLEDCRRQEPLL